MQATVNMADIVIPIVVAVITIAGSIGAAIVVSRASVKIQNRKDITSAINGNAKKIHDLDSRVDVIDRTQAGCMGRREENEKTMFAWLTRIETKLDKVLGGSK